MSKVIIAVHGRGNKPEEEQYKEAWKSAINEGLRNKYGHDRELSDDVTFEMSYYSDIAFTEASNDLKYESAKDGKIRSYESEKVNFISKARAFLMDVPFDSWSKKLPEEFSGISSGLESLTGDALYFFFNHFLFKQYFLPQTENSLFPMKDLSDYYSKPDKRKQVMETLEKDLLAHQDDEIFLISHSMGSIVAYDVLCNIGRKKDVPPLKVKHFVTMGSPLGFLFVKSKVLDVHYEELKVPSCVSQDWKNFSDLRDLVCVDPNLANDYSMNDDGVSVTDVLIANDRGGDPYLDPHHIFGYLRAPEFIEHLHSFL